MDAQFLALCNPVEEKKIMDSEDVRSLVVLKKVLFSMTLQKQCLLLGLQICN